MLTGTDFPLSSFNLMALISSPGCGKTTLTQKIMKQYEKISTQNYDFNNPLEIIYTPYTHKYFVSVHNKNKIPDDYIYTPSNKIFDLIENIK